MDRHIETHSLSRKVKGGTTLPVVSHEHSPFTLSHTLGGCRRDTDLLPSGELFTTEDKGRRSSHRACRVRFMGIISMDSVLDFGG